ncbi:hypothetical protein U27_01421 [Candidatus Vecturithrix granuli]|uniref:Uncharacterized protein n=1 Tax=Vecturithrix granuli TaxID=1499967 RepID=A0A081CAB5_VECG1|nr:hypothetical protein U27_01421 [Candidatus Vecturithrix granuli]
MRVDRVLVKTLIKPWKGLKLETALLVVPAAALRENPNKTLEGIKTWLADNVVVPMGRVKTLIKPWKGLKP